jgi:DNA-binding SARP family transcriptional activator
LSELEKNKSVWYFFILYTISAAYFFNRDFQNFFKCFDKVFEQFDVYGVKSMKIDLYVLKIQSRLLTSNFNEALQDFEFFLDMHVESGIDYSETECFLKGLFEFVKNNYIEAFEFFSKVKLKKSLIYARSAIYKMCISYSDNELRENSFEENLIKIIQENHGFLKVDLILTEPVFYSLRKIESIKDLINHKILRDKTVNDSKEKILIPSSLIQVIVNKKTLKLNLKKSIELFLWLVFHEEGTRGEMIQSIWGDPEDQSNIEYFKVALRKLRLGFLEHLHGDFEPIIFEHGSYSLNSNIQIDCDALDLLKAKSALLLDVDALEFLFTKYRGEVMPGFESSWIVDLRHQLLDAAVTIGERLGTLLLEVDVFKAARVFKRVLELDSYSDIARAGLTRAQGSMSEGARALTRAARLN